MSKVVCPVDLRWVLGLLRTIGPRGRILELVRECPEVREEALKMGYTPEDLGLTEEETKESER